MADLGRTLFDRVLDTEGGHQFAGAENLEGELAVGHGGNPGRERGRIGADTRRLGREGGGQFPLNLALCDGGRGKRGGGSGERSGLQKVTSFHGFLHLNTAFRKERSATRWQDPAPGREVRSPGAE